LDLTDAAGKMLNPTNQELAGNPTTLGSTTIWLQVNQDRPSRDKWMLWRRANKYGALLLTKFTHHKVLTYIRDHVNANNALPTFRVVDFTSEANRESIKYALTIQANFLSCGYKWSVLPALGR
jgi:hypothetical protein